jgi:hypothetical protein
VAIYTGFIPARRPTFNFTLINPQYPSPVADINPIWGVWHYKEHYFSQTGCVVFNYYINSYGARDKERVKKSSDTNRVIVLGDSFMEGFGVNAEDRVSNILENKTGNEFLNFSCADFGTTQEYLVYKFLADSFDHSTVFIGFLPFNDFENDDFSLFSNNSSRYRPFFIKKGSSYSLEYHQDSLFKSEFNKEHYKVYSNSTRNIITRFLRSYTYWFNIFDFIKNRKGQDKSVLNNKKQIVSYYYDYSPEQMDRLKYILGLFREVAKNKRIIFCTIPVITDFKRRNEEKVDPPLSQELKVVCDSLKIEYINLLPMYPKNSDNSRFFLPCDQHWNEKGNLFCANLLLPFFKLR